MVLSFSVRMYGHLVGDREPLLSVLLCIQGQPISVGYVLVPNRTVLGIEAIFLENGVLESMECSRPRKMSGFGDQRAGVVLV